MLFLGLTFYDNRGADGNQKMSGLANGFYAAYLTAANGQGLAMLVFKDGKIIGVDVASTKFDGTYIDTPTGFAVTILIALPPNTPLIQGGMTGPQGESNEVTFELPFDFLSQPFIRIEGKHGPVNVKLVLLRELQ
jgi:hypothetical protein